MQQPNRPSQEDVVEKLAEWVDTRVIAEMIASFLIEEGEAVTVERGKEVWLAALEFLAGGIRVIWDGR